MRGLRKSIGRRKRISEAAGSVRPGTSLCHVGWESPAQRARSLEALRVDTPFPCAYCVRSLLRMQSEDRARDLPRAGWGACFLLVGKTGTMALGRHLFCPRRRSGRHRGPARFRGRERRPRQSPMGGDKGPWEEEPLRWRSSEVRAGVRAGAGTWPA